MLTREAIGEFLGHFLQDFTEPGEPQRNDNSEKRDCEGARCNKRVLGGDIPLSGKRRTAGG
jgi:hypothetical protein